METSKGEWQLFEREWARKIVAGINLVRESQGVTVKELGARLNKAGWPVSQATLSGILSGDKRGSISVTEWLTFSRVLNVPPLFLLLGLPSSSEPPQGALWDKTQPDNYEMFRWLSRGLMFSPFVSPEATEEQRKDENESARLARHIMSLMSSLDEYYEGIIWQSAQLVAASDFKKDKIESSIHANVLNQDFLWDCLEGFQITQKKIDDLPLHWQLSRKSLPESLREVIICEPLKRYEIDLATLAHWHSEKDRDEAFHHISYLIEVNEKNKPRSHRSENEQRIID